MDMWIYVHEIRFFAFHGLFHTVLAPARMPSPSLSVSAPLLFLSSVQISPLATDFHNSFLNASSVQTLGTLARGIGLQMCGVAAFSLPVYVWNISS